MDPEIIIAEEDLPYEEELIRNPFSVKSWLRYAEHKSGTPAAVYTIYERAAQQLPGSYKLWFRYLRYRRAATRAEPPGSGALAEANAAHERALVHMHKMPRIWLDYGRFLTRQGLVTAARRVYDRALRSLPLTQHERVWPPYLKLVRRHAVGDCLETALRVMRRYVKFKPDDREEFVDFLLEHKRLDEAVVTLVDIINDENFASARGQSKYALWQRLCQLLSENPLQITSVNAEAIIRQGIARYTDQVGRLWTSLAEWYLRAGNVSRARDVFEEALATVTTVRDFSQVFDACAEFEEGLVRQLVDDESLESDLALLRFEDLIERRPLLLNSVLLRQNPHCVPEWHKRVQLMAGRPAEQIGVYMEAVKTVDPDKATAGRASSLWTEFAKFYERHGQLEDARTVMERAAGSRHRSVDELAQVWCEWAEMELRHGPPEQALKLLAKATAPPTSGKKVDYYDRSETVQDRLHKCLKLWSFYADLEESFGTLQTARAVYDRMLDLRIATPQIVINFAVMMEEAGYFEEAFKIYERGIALFKWPNVEELWKTYLIKFVERYGGSKLERSRDLFEQCLEHCPAKLCRQFFLLYAQLEEKHGLAKRAMNVYERAIERLPANQRAPMFNVYIGRVAELLGVTHTRPVYEKAVESLPDSQAKEFCVRFAELEVRLGELERARALFSYCSQLCDPRTEPQFWQRWQDFELQHGNEETLKELLRIKRSVMAAFSVKVDYAADPGAGVGDKVDDDDKLDEEATTTTTTTKQQQKKKSSILFVRGEQQDSRQLQLADADNPEELRLDDADDDDDEDDEEEEGGGSGDGEAAGAGGAAEPRSIDIAQQPVPDEVLGSLRKDSDEEGEEGEA